MFDILCACSQSLSSLDGQDDDDSDDDDSDGSYSDQKEHRSPTSSPARSTLSTTPDQSANRSSSCPSVSINFGEVPEFGEPLFPTGKEMVTVIEVLNVCMQSIMYLAPISGMF